MWKGELASTLAKHVNPRTQKIQGSMPPPGYVEGRAARPFFEMHLRVSIFDDRDVLGKFYGQATKGVRWMPWRQQTKKDVASCDKPRGAASRL